MSKLTAVKNEISHILSEKLIPFWLERSVDTKFGGYLTCFDEKGEFTARSKKILSQTPMDRFGDAEELIGTLLFLLSKDASGFVNGIVIPVDGGFLTLSGV